MNKKPLLKRLNFYPRSPCGERRGWTLNINGSMKISIHALLAESDSKSDTATAFPLSFLSTLSLRRATKYEASRASQDAYFYPRSPCGERHSALLVNGGGLLFLSTLSLRRATAKVHKTVGHFCAYGTNFMGIASSC